MTRKRFQSPSAVGDLVSSLFKYHHLDKKVAAYSCIPYWEEIVGSDISRIAMPEKIKGKTVLVVRVKDAVWAQELTLQKESILQKIADHSAGTPLDDIQFVIGGPTRSRRPKGNAE